MYKVIPLIWLIFASFLTHGVEEYRLGADTVVFAGRVSRINKDAKLIRVKIEFENAKFLKKKDRIEFWSDSYPESKCVAYMEGRTNEYLLMSIPNYKMCTNRVAFATGSYLRFYSPDLENSLVQAKELTEILIRKRFALMAKMRRYRNEVNGFVEKMDAINKRYEILRQKMEIEWQNELSALEEDKTKTYLNYKHTEARLNELEFKLQKYRVRNQNLVKDRWSLDPKLYYKK